MWLFNENGRKAYLEFLRNLTPQVLLLSFFLFLGVRLGGLPPENTGVQWLGYIIMICFGGMWALAFAANAHNLYEAVMQNEKGVKEYKSELTRDGIKGWRFGWNLLSYSFRDHPRLVCEVALIIFIIFVANFLAVFSGVFMSLGYLKGMK
jgi:hypothetical protein